jgi:putative ABC transport system permease protein
VTYVEVSWSRLAASALLVVAAIIVSSRLALGLGRALVVGALRAAAQLVAIGYLLLFLFTHQSAPLVLSVLAAMLLVAAVTSARRIEHGPPTHVLFGYALAAIAAGAAVALVPVFAIIVSPRPWFEARYLIPIGGMMLSSAMNVVAQVFERVFSLAHTERSTIEQLLALGASPRQALEPHARTALRAALIPTINGLLTLGLVALPGMMSGQILSGTAPEQAVRYQLVIVYQLVAVAAVSGGVAVAFARRLLFTSREQLRDG